MVTSGTNRLSLPKGQTASIPAAAVARGATGRDLIVKFSGCYHGHADGLLQRPEFLISAAFRRGAAPLPGEPVESGSP